MDTAIDISILGKQKEVNASDYTSNYYGYANRFKCPECGESVSLVIPKNTNYKKHFRHKKQTDISQECERRINSIQNQSIYERLGIPLYLRKNGSMYYLAAGFRQIPDDILGYCESSDGKLTLNIDGYKSEYAINHLRFHSEAPTYIKLSRLPKKHSKISLEISSPSRFYVKKYWSNYINSLLPKYGSLFSMKELQGKIVRPRDTISTYTPYYWVTSLKICQLKKEWQLKSIFEKNDIKKIGIIKMDIDYFIYELSINVSLQNPGEYKSVYDFFENNMDLYLLEKPSTVVPLWPPCTKSNDGYVIETDRDIYGRIVSPNDEPVIFQYLTDFRTTTSYDIKNPNDYLQIIPVQKDETFVTVDRRLSSTGLLFRKRKKDYKGLKSILMMEDEDLTTVNVKKIKPTKALNFKSLQDLIIIRIVKNSVIEIKKVSGIFSVENIVAHEHIYFLSGHNLIFRLAVEEDEFSLEGRENEITIFDERVLLCLIKQSVNKYSVYITPRMRQIIQQNLPIIENGKIINFFNKSLKHGLLPINVLDYMERELN